MDVSKVFSRSSRLLEELDATSRGVVLAVAEDQDSVALIFVKEGVEILDELLQLLGLRFTRPLQGLYVFEDLIWRTFS